MSWEALNWASKLKVGGITDKMVLITLANYADEQGCCYPSHKKIAEISECSVLTIIRALQRLEKKGFIKIEPRFQKLNSDKSRQTSNLYKLLFESDILGGYQNDIGGGYHKDTPITNKNKPYTKIFEQFWFEYPNRPNDNKFGAFLKFEQAIKNVKFDYLLAKTKLFAQSQKGKDTKFIPHAKTWLHQKRYDDIIEIKETKVNLNKLVG